MKATSKEIMEAALKLSEKDRVSMVERLLETLSPDEGDLVDDSWDAELDRRLEDFKRHPDTSIPWEQLKGQE